MRQVTCALASMSLRIIGLAGTAALLGGCQAIAITAAGIGASTGLSHTTNSISQRTFTAPDHQVRQATLAALGRMGAKVEAAEKGRAVEVIRATVADRSIEVEVEALNDSTTRISASAQRGLFVYDGATAREIVAQTEAAMSEQVAHRRARGPSRSLPALADSTSGAPSTQR
jgi:hypothetical protein